ncbi:probable 2-oxoglutarate-dependent dioxygenase AOP1 [Andrographis paniculata]|uniref:probable 2-oxoglutarate-dependent dioxygenase AOP1 n=1 Tax=Andrographis paniculata TaxID=175694 RepID=UPI0021E9200A|nr:probable 2-oxoglutarate-dependent dioxygenase AOP1 [Andrographis paniculata]
MGSEYESDHSKLQLPSVRLSQLNSTPGSISWKSTAEIVRRALETDGCLVVACDNKPPPEAMFSGLLEELFALPPSTKIKHTSDLPGFGYGGNFSLMPLFEYFGIEDGATVDAARRFTRLMWPHGHPTFSESLHAYCKALLEVYGTVMGMVVSSYGLDTDKYHNELTASPLYMTRIMKYKISSNSNSDSVGIIPHRDKSFMTVIGTNEVNGLQIETPAGDWVDFHPSPASFIVIVGEALMAWSNGRIYCPLHKVIAHESKEKYSIGIFSFIRGVVSVPPELVDDQNPLRFKPFRNLEFLRYCKAGGATMASAIRTYCGL